MHDDKTVESLADCLVEANRAGRPIIPVVGAGISADSGFPVLRSIVRYFGKLRSYIDRQLWLPAGPISVSSATGRAKSERYPLNSLAEFYAKHPWQFVRDFGWPDRFQLNEDLLTRIEVDSIPMNQEVQNGLDNFLKDSSPAWRMDLLEKRRTEITKTVEALKLSGLGDLSAWSKRFETAIGADPKVAAPFERELKDAWCREMALLSERIGQQLTRDEAGKSVAMDLIGDWKRMILDFSRFQGDDADALFARFARDHEPNLAHRYLAFLIRRLNVPVIFTMNFDPFIEQVLQDEDLRPRTFAMEHGLTLPHSSLVREQLAVIKMHGSTHALLLDEQLDRPLSRDYLERFERIVGKDPLLFVIGCSGEDTRLLDLVRQAVERARDDDSRPRVAWLHFEPKPPSTVEAISRNPHLLRFRQTRHLGGTLTHLYSAIDKLHPSSRSFYLTHFAQPFLLDRQVRSRADGCLTGTSKQLTELIQSPTCRGILVQSLKSSVPADPEQFPNPSASRQLLWMGSDLPIGFKLVWVDLEAVHTLSAVAGSIIDQCRRYDSSLAPCVLPQDDDAVTDDEKFNQIIARALKRVVRALRRARYFVAFDGLETYTWSPTAHHGDTHSTSLDEGKRRLQALVRFLADLSKAELGESRFAVSVDTPRPRRGWGKPVEGLQRKDIAPLEDGVKLGHIRDWNDEIEREKNWGWQARRYDKTFRAEAIGSVSHLQAVQGWEKKKRPQWALALSILATFRRTRPLALVHHLLRPVLGAGNQQIDKFLEQNQGHGIFRSIEGGGIWFFRRLRDFIYDQHTNQTSTEAMRGHLARVSDAYGEAVFQLLLNTATHQLVARGWYGAAFIQSHDTSALLEYFYHRLASVRTLTKLIKLLEVAKGNRRCLAQIARGRQAFATVVATAHNQIDLLDSFEMEVGFLKESPAKMLEALAWRHREESSRLLRVWRKSESALRAQVPAEQLLRWCKQFSDDDLKKRCHRVVTGDGERDSQPVVCLRREAESGGAITEMREYLADFTAKILMDRSDYEQCREQRTKDYNPGKNLVTDVERFLSKKKPAALTADQIRLAHHRLDIIGSQFRQAQEEKMTVKDLLPATKRCARDLAKWKRYNDCMLEEGAKPGLHELQLRGLHFMTNCHFRRVCVFSHDGFSGKADLKQSGKNFSLVGFDSLANADLAIRHGNRIARLLSKPQSDTPHSFSINAVVDGTLYLPYRDTFLIQQARHRWMKATNESALVQHKGHRRSNELLASVDDALCEFEKARAGLSGTNQLTLALTDLYAVEACLAHARVVLRSGSLLPSEARVDNCFELARSRYETVRGLLGRAREALMGAQRNVIWWRFFFQLTAQYHADRLLLGLANLFDPEDRQPADLATLKLGSYIHRFRRGLESVENASELYLQPAHPVERNWIPRLRRELTICAFAIGLVIWRLRERSIFREKLSAGAKTPSFPFARDKVIEYLWQPLDWMTHVAGLEEKLPTDYIDTFNDLYDEIPLVKTDRFDFKGNHANTAELRKAARGKLARRLRDNIIDYAANRST